MVVVYLLGLFVASGQNIAFIYYKSTGGLVFIVGSFSSL